MPDISTVRIVYQAAGGGIGVMTPNPSARQKVVGQDGVERYQTDKEFIEWVAQKDVPAGSTYKVVDVSELPADRSLRRAWKLHPAIGVVEDVVVAREITKDRLRAERAPLLADLDTQFLRALETGADASVIGDIAARKQALRDVTKLADQAATVADLKSLSVSGL